MQPDMNEGKSLVPGAVTLIPIRYLNICEIGLNIGNLPYLTSSFFDRIYTKFLKKCCEKKQNINMKHQSTVTK